MNVFQSGLIIFLCCSGIAFAQKIDNMAGYRDMGSERYFRYHYDNDYFASTDQNYTQGYNFELLHPALKKNPVNFLLPKPKNTQNRFGLSLEHIGFTPDNIKSDAIQHDDRPFAAAIMLKSFVTATDTLHKSRLISSLNTGLIGPGAFGKEMQVAIHKATGNTIPGGWENQIKNDLVLNYEITYEKQLLRYRNFFALQTLGTLRMGTLFTNASVGVSGVLGIINSPFDSTKQQKRFRLYLYSQPILSAVAYDATLQGGLINNRSPYNIAGAAIERFTAQHNYGIILQTKTLYFEYARAAITREFSYGNAAKWGGIKLGFRF